MRTTWLGLLWLALMWPPTTLAAQPVSAAPAVVRPKRLVHFFDFEERKFGNFESLPMHWYVTGRPAGTSDPNFTRQPLHRALIDRPGFPEWTDVRFDTRHAVSGEFSFYLGQKGGNAGAYLEVGTLPAVPTSDYLVGAHVRTDGLHRAGARLVVYFIDAQGVEVPDSRAYSGFIRNEGEWQEVSVRLGGDFPAAAYIGLELELLQPTASNDSPLGNQQVVLKDVGGGAWFDDISVWQLPHVEVTTQSEVNVVRAPHRLQLSVDVRDLTGQRLGAEVTVYDHRFRPVAREERQVGAGEPMSWRWTPELPGFGWYLVDLLVREATGPNAGPDAPPVARTVSAALWLPPPRPLPSADRARFALVAEALPLDEMALLPQVLDASKLDAVVISAWARETTLETLESRQEAIDELLRFVLTSGRHVTMSLHPVPKELAEQQGVDTAHPLSVLAGDEGAWLPYLAPILMRQGQRVRNWQLGQSHDAEGFFRGDLSGLLGTIDARFRALAPQPRLILPWRLDQGRMPDLSEELVLAVDVPASVSPEHIADHLREWRDPPAQYWLYLHEPPADVVDHDGRVVDLALRMVHGWEAGAAALALPRPWTTAVERRQALWPDPLLGVFTNVAQRLAGRRVLGRLAIGDGLEAVVLDGGTEGGRENGTLIAWRRDADPVDAFVHMHLGGSPRALDVWGNPVPVGNVGAKHHVPLTAAPTFIEGIDTELAMFRAGFRVTPSFVESLQAPHQHELTVTNPWARTINGNLRFTGPEGWRVQPEQHHFSLSPGQTMRLPITMSFPFAELAGSKRLTARFDFTADRRYVVDVSAPLELGLEEVEFHPTAALVPTGEPGQFDVELVCIVTNTGARSKQLSVFAQLRNHPRDERSIANLQPGQSVVRRFIFKKVTPEDRQAPLRTGVRETNGPAVLNRLLPLDG